MQDLQSEEKGRQLFQSGLLSEALLAFEAEVQRNPDNVQAWRLLGTVHAENDDDRQVVSFPSLAALMARLDTVVRFRRCKRTSSIMVHQLCVTKQSLAPAGHCARWEQQRPPGGLISQPYRSAQP